MEDTEVETHSLWGDKDINMRSATKKACKPLGRRNNETLLVINGHNS